MKRVNLFFCLLLQPLWLCAQTILPLVSPAEILKAEIRVSDKFVDIDLFDKGGKVVEAKTLQLELDKTILAGNWQVARSDENFGRPDLATGLRRTFAGNKPV